MGKIHHLHTGAESQARLLEKWIVETIAEYPDSAVASRWAELARETAKKYPGPPSPSKTELDLSLLNSLPDSDKEQIVLEVQSFLASYFNDVRTQLMNVHGDLLRLQKRVAELEQGRTESSIPS